MLSVICGVIGLLFCILPYISVLIAVLAIYSGRKGLEAELGKLAKIGILMGTISLILSVFMTILIMK